LSRRSSFLPPAPPVGPFFSLVPFFAGFARSGNLCSSLPRQPSFFDPPLLPCPSFSVTTEFRIFAIPSLGRIGQWLLYGADSCVSSLFLFEARSPNFFFFLFQAGRPDGCLSLASVPEMLSRFPFVLYDFSSKVFTADRSLLPSFFHSPMMSTAHCVSCLGVHLSTPPCYCSFSLSCLMYTQRRGFGPLVFFFFFLNRPRKDIVRISVAVPMRPLLYFPLPNVKKVSLLSSLWVFFFSLL